MAKGSLFVGSGSGKVGNLVLANTKSGQVTRAYQPKVSNPKTRAQMLQRAKFANAVKFFQQMTAGFFHFAFEDKKQNESDYNAFMRHNIKYSLPMTREAYQSPYIPAVGNKWLLSKGRLALPGDVGVISSGTSGGSFFAIINSYGEDVGTVATASAKLIASGFAAGDIVTLVRVHTANVLGDSGGYPPAAIDPSPVQVGLAQFVINTADATALSAVKTAGSNPPVFSLQSGSLGFSIDSDAQWAGMVVTRLQDSVLYCTTSYLEGSNGADNIVGYLGTDAAIDAVVDSWGAKGTAILKGSIANALKSL